jgi:threonine/homoserine/homoserine lactone efflux protein
MTEWTTVITITCFAVISPGPDFAMVSRNALALSKRAGHMTALGIALGVLVHVSYTLLGIDLLLKYAPTLLDILKLAGSAYLIWLGFKMIVPATKYPHTPTAKRATSDSYALRIGFWTNALNPKTSIFIISVFTQIVAEQTLLITQFAYGGFISIAHYVWFAAVALFFGAPSLQKTLLGASRWIDTTFGIILIGFGISLIFENLSL